MTFQALREFRQRISEGSGTTAREKPHAKRAGGTVADIYTYISGMLRVVPYRGVPTTLHVKDLRAVLTKSRGVTLAYHGES